MPYPILIDVCLVDRPSVRLIFQARVTKEHNERNGHRVLPIACVDDGALFLREEPGAYVGQAILLANDHLGEEVFDITAKMVGEISQADQCSFGVVGVGGRGPGFTYDGSELQHNQLLGIKETVEYGHDGRQKFELHVLDNRAGKRESNLYYDEEDWPERHNADAAGEDGATNMGGDGMDIDMAEMNIGGEKSDADLAEQMQRRLRKLRLKER